MALLPLAAGGGAKDFTLPPLPENGRRADAPVDVDVEVEAFGVSLEERMGKLMQIDNDLQSFGFIYKKGDDVRQDMLILQLVKQMDRWLLSANLNLEITTYAVLASSAKIGLLEMVPGCKTMSGIKEKHGTILNFLKEAGGHMDSEVDLGVSEEVLEVFARSCAGWAVASYVLGIGDRHFDNILVQDTGRLVHIDFGWAFGHDPKEITGMTSPIRFNQDMLSVLGGTGHKWFKRCVEWCCDAYLVIRSRAAELKVLIQLMRRAGIEHLGVGGAVDETAATVCENLCLWLTEAEARKHMEKLLRTCLASKGQDRLEMMHTVAMVFKK